MVGMPLSEREQRILAELEDSLSRHDPRFAERVSTETVYTHAAKICKWSVLGFVVGIIVLFFYVLNVVIGLLGIAIMFSSAVVFERNARKLGKTGWADFRRSLHANEPPQDPNAIENTVHSARDWVRSHLFRRDS
jgi:hypothetical protein